MLRRVQLQIEQMVTQMTNGFPDTLSASCKCSTWFNLYVGSTCLYLQVTCTEGVNRGASSETDIKKVIRGFVSVLFFCFANF